MSIQANIAIIEWSSFVFVVTTEICLLALVFFGWFRRTRALRRFI